MAKFEFDCVCNLGFSHCGSVDAYGNGTVELSADDVTRLVDLIREMESTDIEELQLKDKYPDIYKTLDDAFRDAAREATINHWYMQGFYDWVYEYDIDELMDYCSENHDFVFEYDEEDYVDEDGEIDEDRIWDDKTEAFDEWLEIFLEGLDNSSCRKFLEEHLNAEVDLSDLELDYEIEIPKAIIDMVD
jgi:hypothetical protein